MASPQPHFGFTLAAAILSFSVLSACQNVEIGQIETRLKSPRKLPFKKALDQKLNPESALPSALPNDKLNELDKTPKALGQKCESASSESQLCLGLKYVVYQDEPLETVDELAAIANTQEINAVWNQCGISFQIDEYLTANPDEYQLTHETSEMTDLEQIRGRFKDDKNFLIVTTGRWNRSGSLGNTGANAWTNMPGGDSPHGIVLEGPTGKYAVLIAHELGHYLGLDHEDDSNNVMNPLIYTQSTRLDSEQCARARSIAYLYWTPMIRNALR